MFTIARSMYLWSLLCIYSFQATFQFSMCVFVRRCASACVFIFFSVCKRTYDSRWVCLQFLWCFVSCNIGSHFSSLISTLASTFILWIVCKHLNSLPHKSPSLSCSLSVCVCFSRSKFVTSRMHDSHTQKDILVLRWWNLLARSLLKLH